MDSITLKYIDSNTAVVYTRTFSALRVKGFDPVDDLEDYPNIVHQIIDGSLLHQTVGIRRNFTVELGVLLTVSERLFVGNFFRSIAKYLTYTHDYISETIQVVRNDSVFETEWKLIKFGTKEFPNWSVIIDYLMCK